MNISTATSSDPRSHNLPSKWANDLLYEISAKETVRDSTLRRSTGIALGFLSIMRSEPPATVSPRTICPFVLSNLVRLSLPPELETKKRLKSFDCGSMEEIFIFPKYLNYSEDSQCTYISDSDYQARSRVHALNVLRFSILDAPLATEMRKFVGDAIVSALLGYNDKSWGVRNSATMVFSAAMLRVIDADKNASSNEHKTNKSSVKVILLYSGKNSFNLNWAKITFFVCFIFSLPACTWVSKCYFGKGALPNLSKPLTFSHCRVEREYGITN